MPRLTSLEIAQVVHEVLGSLDRAFDHIPSPQWAKMTEDNQRAEAIAIGPVQIAIADGKKPPPHNVRQHIHQQLVESLLALSPSPD